VDVPVVDFLLENWVLVLAAVTSGGLLLWPQFSGRSGATRIDTAEAVRLMNREKAVLLDVSEPAEHAAGHPPGARNVPLGTLDGAGAKLPSNKATPIVLVCPTGARAGRAVGLLKKLGHERVYALAGGLGAWRGANLPVEKSPA
jgi:rhodanese-related sulfurtransferase